MPSNLTELVARKAVPAPWEEGENIPWNDQQFSERMLDEHLSQDHDLASRRNEKIRNHVEWIHDRVLGGAPRRVLELACGPGLYTNSLARKGHSCLGVDFSPASIDHARRIARGSRLSATYELQDVRRVEPPAESQDLVMMIYGQLNVFRREEARALVERAHETLAAGGALLLEPQMYTAVEERGRTEPSWRTVDMGLFSSTPHLWLEEHFWDEKSRIATERHIIVDAESAAVDSYAMSTVAYTDSELRALLREVGFVDVEVSQSLQGAVDPSQLGLFVITARKGGIAEDRRARTRGT